MELLMCVSLFCYLPNNMIWRKEYPYDIEITNQSILGSEETYDGSEHIEWRSDNTRCFEYELI